MPTLASTHDLAAPPSDHVSTINNTDHRPSDTPSFVSTSTSPVRRGRGSPRRSMNPDQREPSIVKNKRASLILPVPVHARPPLEQQVSRTSTTSTSPSRRESIPTQAGFVSTESDYFTALAAQERRVFELKEELQKAEGHLQRLKKQWANHETAKRRDERQRGHQLRPILPASPKIVDDGDEDGANAWMYEEMARRKALLSNTRTSHRRVFSGSRRTMALSLLEPVEGEDSERGNDSDVTSEPRPLKPSPRAREQWRSRELVKKSVGLPRASTTPNLWQAGDYTIDPIAWARGDSQSPQREAILRTGKQVATDLREGLWTFLEDLRQVAIGDEPRPAQSSSDEPRRQNSKRINREDGEGKSERYTIGRSPRTIGRPSSKQDVDNMLVDDLDVTTPRLVEVPIMKRSPRQIGTSSKGKSARRPKTPPPATPQDSDSWETWESPAPVAPPLRPQDLAASPSISSASASSTASTPNTIISDVLQTSDSTDSTPKLGAASQRAAIPWPSLGLAPDQIRRTASHLMEEWEKSLAPSPTTSPTVVRTGKRMD